jgi:hypothetical protein
MTTDFTESQLSLMDERDIEDIKRARSEGFKMPRYIRMFKGLSGEVKADEQLFSPAALRIVSNGKRYPENATPENCERLIAIWNERSSCQYAMV